MLPTSIAPQPTDSGVLKTDSVPFSASLVEVTEHDANPQKGLIAVIPAYNEQIALGSVVLLARQYVDRVIVIDDGSTDRTSEVAKLAGAEVIRLDQNTGKAYALLLGLKRARELGCTAAVMLDADGQHYTRNIPRLAVDALSGDADLVIGSRFLSGKGNIPLYRRAGQKTLDIFTSVGTKLNISDSQSGFRALSWKALDHLDFKSAGYNIESDMIAHFAAQGLTIKEIPIDVRYDVPYKHKKNPMAHGLSVLAGIINIISYKRPLLVLGVPGFILFVLGGGILFLSFTEYFLTRSYSLTISLIGSTLLGVGMLLGVAALILNVLVRILERREKLK